MNKIKLTRCILIEKVTTFEDKVDLEYQIIDSPTSVGSEWQLEDSSGVHHVKKSEYVPVIEAHWSVSSSDGHVQDDADATYCVLLENGVKELFSKLSDAKDFIRRKV